MNSIFISYSHRDEPWKNRLFPFLKVLEKQGYCTTWNDRDIEPGSGWFEEIEKALQHAHIIIMLVSTNFLASDFINQEEIPRILERRQKDGAWVIPLVIEPCSWSIVPWLKTLQLFPKDGKPLSKRRKSTIEEILTELVERIAERINRGGQLPPEGSFQALPPERISIAKLPATGKDLFGREKELELLNTAWADTHIHVVTLVAWGGVGKSALLNKWVNSMVAGYDCGSTKNDNQLQDSPHSTSPLPQKVFGWSFYSQGAEEGKQASADEFLHTALEWFGDSDPKAGSNVDKGRRLAALVRKEKTLLLLDGLEPLQYPPGELRGFEGLIKDHGLKTLIKDLAAGQPGLCVITTREPVTDLSDKTGHTVKEVLLDNLSIEAGVQVLKSLGISGIEQELSLAVEEYTGHALALTLLGNYVRTRFQGDIRQRDKIPALTLDKKKGQHARRVMEAYEELYKVYPKNKFLKRFKRFTKIKPELNILRLMGLFDRPVDKGAIDAVIAPEQAPIPGITEKLQNINENDWDYALDNLRSSGLLAKADPLKPNVLDCHPLVREHFGEKLRLENPDSWKMAHKRLYEYYKALPDKEYPDTLEEMEPLFAAVAHGCAAGLHQETMDDVYWQRILRKNESYNTSKLGAFGSDLASLSHFFQVPWKLPTSGLIDSDKALVLSWAGFGLRALGRLQEAIQPMQAGMTDSIQKKDWKGAAQDAGNLSELSLTLGQVDQAVEYARQSVEYADQSGNNFQKESKRTTLADALHQQGKLREAEQWFQEAEELQKKRQPEYNYLYSLQGFQFCDLLIGQRKIQEVLERAEHAIRVSELNNFSLISFALDKLSMGRAWLQQSLIENPQDFSRAHDYLHEAVAGLRKSGYQEFLIKGLFARAELFRYQGKLKEAWTDLKEAEEIARLGSMGLYLADFHLEAAKLLDADKKPAEAQKHREDARKMVIEMNYMRRAAECGIRKPDSQD